MVHSVGPSFTFTEFSSHRGCLTALGEFPLRGLEGSATSFINTFLVCGVMTRRHSYNLFSVSVPMPPKPCPKRESPPVVLRPLSPNPRPQPPRPKPSFVSDAESAPSSSRIYPGAIERPFSNPHECVIATIYCVPS